MRTSLRVLTTGLHTVTTLFLLLCFWATPGCRCSADGSTDEGVADIRAQLLEAPAPAVDLSSETGSLTPVSSQDTAGPHMAGALYQRTYPELNRQPHRRCVIKGRIDETRVVSMVQAGIPALSACFPDALTQPHRVVAHALVSASGIIQMAVVPDSTMANDAVHRCVIQTVKKWTTGPLDSGDQLILILPFHVDTRGRLTMVPDPQEGLVTHALIARDSCP